MEENFIKSIFSWKYFNVYLCGPIDAAEDGGQQWREDYILKLIDMGFKKEQIFNPCKKPISHQLFNLDNEQKLMHDAKNKEDWDGLCEIVDQIAHIDLRLIDFSSLMIAYFPIDKKGNRVPTYGSMHEIVEARRQKKPVFVVWPGGKKTCSGWLMWLVGHKNIFETIEELIEHLKKVSNGEVPYNAKDWLLLNLDKIK